MMNKDIRAKIRKIQARAEKATPGPWKLETEHLSMVVKSPIIRTKPGEMDFVLNEEWYVSPDPADYEATKRNLTFCASARSDVLWLCQMLLKLLAQKEESKGG